MDNSNNYINQNEELRNALLDLLFGGPISIPIHNNIVTQADTNENIPNNLNSIHHQAISATLHFTMIDS